MVEAIQVPLTNSLSPAKQGALRSDGRRRGEGEYNSVPSQDINDIERNASQMTHGEIPPVSTAWIYILSIASFGVGSSWAL